MEKDNKIKLIFRILVILFVLFSLYTAAYPPTQESIWLTIPFAFGMLTWLGIAVVSILILAGLAGACVRLFLNWAFNTDFFD
jgi:hypothetical protein